MTVRGWMAAGLLCGGILTTLPAGGHAQSCDLPDLSCATFVPSKIHGLTGYEYLSLSSDSFGQLMRLDTSIGYDFNEHFGVDVGVPFYFAHGSPVTGGAFSDGSGDFYTDLRFTILNPTLNFSSILTGTAPTGNAGAGFSTGRVTFDWDNRFDRDFSRFQPFAEIGIANSISDTGGAVHPYTTLGLVTHFEGGANYQAFRLLAVGGSAYEDLTSGQQKLYSRLVARGFQLSAPCSSLALFACTSEAAGTGELTRDHGFSFWLKSNLAHGVDLRFSYTRSARYQLNTFFLGVGVNLGPLFHKAQSLARMPTRRSSGKGR